MYIKRKCEGISISVYSTELPASPVCMIQRQNGIHQMFAHALGFFSGMAQPCTNNINQEESSI